MKPDKQPSFKRLKEQARDKFCNSFTELAKSKLRQCLNEAKLSQGAGHE